MNKMVVDQTIRSKLQELGSTTQFCDESGHTLGYFIPASEHERLLYAWARGEFTDDEIERARRQEGGFSLKDILAELGEP